MTFTLYEQCFSIGENRRAVFGDTRSLIIIFSKALHLLKVYGISDVAQYFF